MTQNIAEIQRNPRSDHRSTLSFSMSSAMNFAWAKIIAEPYLGHEGGLRI